MASTTESVYLHDLPLPRAWEQFRTALASRGRWDPVQVERIPLDQAVGRVTAQAVWARISSPHYHAAAMDGYALPAAESEGATDREPRTLLLGTKVKYVDTGQPLPPGTNAVVPVEAVELRTADGADSIVLRSPVYPWANVRAMGEDMVATELVLPAGQRLRPVDLGAIAASGHAQVSVRRRPRVAILPTGTELVSPGVLPEPGQIVEYNSLVLAAQVDSWGGQARRVAGVADDLNLIRSAVRQAAADCDLLLVIAGSSAGSQDHSAGVVAELGELLVHGVAVRPGHPVILGVLQEGIPIIGVPGYPVSAALTGEIFVRPLLRRWLGLPAWEPQKLSATLTRKVHSTLGDDEYLRVSVGVVGERTVATPLSRGAGVISSLVRADGIVRIPAGVQGHSAGAQVEVELYRTPQEIERTIVIIGSHDLTLDLLGQRLALRGRRLSSASVGSLGGLIALRRGEAHLAGSHLLDPATGEYNRSYVQQQLSDVPTLLLGFVERQQGLIVAAGNPKNIQQLQDLSRPDVTFVNRQRGAGTRVLLDYQLEQLGLAADRIDGYAHEEYTHLAVGAAIAAGQADAGLGIQAAAQALELDFVPLYAERYDLVIPRQHYEDAKLSELLEIVRSAEFAEAVGALPGYRVKRMGEVLAELP